jgi:cephalosporin-C deacetylase-like acetyl esterase
MKKLIFLIIIASLISCAIIKPKIANRSVRITYTEQQQNDSIFKFSKKFDTIFAKAVYADTNYFQIKNGVLTFKDSVAFKIALIEKLWVGKPKTDTLITHPPHQ